MLKVAVVDCNAESRQRVVDELYSYLRENADDLCLIPRIDIRQLARSEIKFHESPDILIVGDAIAREQLADIQAIRKSIPDCALVVRLTEELASLTLIEQLARYGVDDTYCAGARGSEVLRKIVLLGRRKRKHKSGQLIAVDSGKGGVGVTTITAALGDLWVMRGKRVVLVDFDCETQDLSRFLQSRPFVNENLQLLLEEQRPINEESVKQCLNVIFESDTGSLSCMPPIAESENLYSSGARYSRILISILEVLDSCFDVVIVDCGSARGAILKTLYRVADHVIFAISNDPASLYASVDRFNKVRGSMSVTADLIAVVNTCEHKGLALSILKSEFCAAVEMEHEIWAPEVLPCCRYGRRWPGSGGTLAGLGSKSLRKSLHLLVDRISGDLKAGARSEASPCSKVWDHLRTLPQKLFIRRSQNRAVSRDNQAIYSLAEPPTALQLPDSSEQENMGKLAVLPLPKIVQGEQGSELGDSEDCDDLSVERLVSGAKFS